MKKKIAGIVLASLLAFGCEKNNQDEDGDNELITTIRLKFTEGGSTKTFTFKDLDGDGGNAPIIENISLASNKTYKLDIELLDESKSPAEDITAEVKTEALEHLLVYSATPSTLFTYTYDDKDGRNFPIGLTGSLRTSTAGTGKLKVQLRHQPEVNGKPVKDGTASPGSDDVNIDFNFTIQ